MRPHRPERRFRFRPPGSCLVFLVFCLASGPLPAAAPPAKPPPPLREVAGGPYCGVYSVYAALNVHGITPRFSELLEEKYVGAPQGSSLKELKRAVVDFGGYAEAMEGLTASALRRSPHPIILHVRRPGPKTDYAHWVLFLGVEGDKARIVDPPNAVEKLPFAELLSLWDGTGLVVSDRPVRTWPIRAAAWFEQGIFLLLAAAVLGGIRVLAAEKASARRRWRVPVVMMSLTLLAAGVAALGHLVHDEGFLRNPTAVAQVVLQHFEPELPVLSLEEARALAREPDVVFLDVRRSVDYQLGHLPGAINLPVYAGLVERSETLAAIKPTARVVVYCQSAQCDWGEKIAADLAFRGYGKVALFPGGYEEWQRSESAKPNR